MPSNSDPVKPPSIPNPPTPHSSTSQVSHPVTPVLTPVEVTPIPSPTSVAIAEVERKNREEQASREHQAAFAKGIRESKEVGFLEFPEKPRLTRTEFLNRVQDIVRQHCSDSNSANKAYVAIEAITP